MCVLRTNLEKHGVLNTLKSDRKKLTKKVFSDEDAQVSTKDSRQGKKRSSKKTEQHRHFEKKKKILDVLKVDEDMPSVNIKIDKFGRELYF